MYCKQVLQPSYFEVIFNRPISQILGVHSQNDLAKQLPQLLSDVYRDWFHVAMFVESGILYAVGHRLPTTLRRLNIKLGYKVINGVHRRIYLDYLCLLNCVEGGIHRKVDLNVFPVNLRYHHKQSNIQAYSME